MIAMGSFIFLAFVGLILWGLLKPSKQPALDRAEKEVKKGESAKEAITFFSGASETINGIAVLIAIFLFFMGQSNAALVLIMFSLALFLFHEFLGSKNEKVTKKLEHDTSVRDAYRANKVTEEVKSGLGEKSPQLGKNDKDAEWMRDDEAKKAGLLKKRWDSFGSYSG